MARRTKLTPEVKAKLVQALGLGATIEIACKYAGIDDATYYRWMQKAETQKAGDCRELRDALKEAEGRAALGWLAKIEKAANDGTWQAAAWKLERRYPDDYGRRDPRPKDETTKTTTNDRPLPELTDEEVAALVNERLGK